MLFALRKVEGVYGGRTTFSPTVGAIINHPLATIPKMVHLSNFLDVKKSSCSELRDYHVRVELCFWQGLDKTKETRFRQDKGEKKNSKNMIFFL